MSLDRQTDGNCEATEESPSTTFPKVNTTRKKKCPTCDHVVGNACKLCPHCNTKIECGRKKPRVSSTSLTNPSNQWDLLKKRVDILHESHRCDIVILYHKKHARGHTWGSYGTPGLVEELLGEESKTGSSLKNIFRLGILNQMAQSNTNTDSDSNRDTNTTTNTHTTTNSSTSTTANPNSSTTTNPNSTTSTNPNSSTANNANTTTNPNSSTTANPNSSTAYNTSTNTTTNPNRSTTTNSSTANNTSTNTTTNPNRSTTNNPNSSTTNNTSTNTTTNPNSSTANNTSTTTNPNSSTTNNSSTSTTTPNPISSTSSTTNPNSRTNSTTTGPNSSTSSTSTNPNSNTSTTTTTTNISTSTTTGNTSSSGIHENANSGKRIVLIKEGTRVGLVDNNKHIQAWGVVHKRAEIHGRIVNPGYVVVEITQVLESCNLKPICSNTFDDTDAIHTGEFYAWPLALLALPICKA